MDFPVGLDLTKSAFSQYNWTEDVRPTPGSTYLPGMAVQAASADNQIWGDYRTAKVPAATAALNGILGIVAPDWGGFDGNGNPLTGAPASSYTSFGTLLNVRGTQAVKLVMFGYALALVDNTSGAAAVTDNSLLVTSATTAGYLQEAASGSPGSAVAFALLPAAGLGSSLGSGAIAAAHQTDTIAGTPAAGDVLTVTVQLPYQGTPINPINPGTPYTYTVSHTLSAADATSVTTAAASLVTACTNDATFSKYYSASNAAGVITVTLNAGNPFLVTYQLQQSQAGFAFFSTSGTFGNNLSFAVSAAGGSTATAGGATLTGGTGYKGLCPVFVL